MSTMIPPSSPVPPGPLDLPSAVPATVLITLPETFPLLTSGDTLEITVIKAPQDGLIIGQTPHGPLTIRIPLPLSPGTTVSLLVLPDIPSGTRNTLPVRIIAIDGKSSHHPALTPDIPTPPSALPPLPGDILSIGNQILHATLSEGLTPGRPVSPLPPGTVLSFRLTLLSPPSPVSPGHPTPAAMVETVPPLPSFPKGGPDAGLPPMTTPGSPPASTSSDTPDIPATGKPSPFPATPLPVRPLSSVLPLPETATGTTPETEPVTFPFPSPGMTDDTEVPLPRMTSPQLPQSSKADSFPSPDVPLSPEKGTLLKGRVLPSSGSPLSLIKTDIGIIVLDRRLPLPDHTLVEMELTAPPLPPLQAQKPLPSRFPLDPMLPPGISAWKSLEDAMALLSRTEPEAARSLSQALPAPNIRFAINTLAFLAASAGGELQYWTPIAKALRALEKNEDSGCGLLKQLHQEFKEISTRPHTTGEWRVHTLPFLVGPHIECIQIITRRLSGSPDEENTPEERHKGGGLRFVITLSLSALGPLQLDGFYKEKKRGLDLVIRSHIPLPADIRHDLPKLFSASLPPLGLTGSLTFSVMDHFPVHPFPSPDRTSTSSPGIIV